MGWLNKETISNIKIPIPKSNKILTNLNPKFIEIEKFQSSIKKNEKLYKKVLQELKEDAIINNQ